MHFVKASYGSYEWILNVAYDMTMNNMKSEKKKKRRKVYLIKVDKYVAGKRAVCLPGTPNKSFWHMIQKDLISGALFTFCSGSSSEITRASIILVQNMAYKKGGVVKICYGPGPKIASSQVYFGYSRNGNGS